MLRKSTVKDIDRLAPILRESDILEIQASTGQTPREALEDGLERSDLCYTMLVGGDVICTGGVAPSGYNPDVGVAWFLSSDRLAKSAVALQWYMPQILRKMHRLYPNLANFVDARNIASVAWLTRLGFKVVGTDEFYGVEHRPFHWFVKGKEVCVPQQSV